MRPAFLPRHPARAARRATLLSVVAALCGFASLAHAVDRFEIQVYDGTANAVGLPTLENHVNFVDRGRRSQLGALAATDHQAHWTFEGALGVTPFWEPGLYLQTAFVPGEGYVFGGVKLRSKFVTPETFSRWVRLGANFELADVPPRFEESRWSIELRPIVALSLPILLVSVNPILSFPLAQGALRSGPAFEPALSVKGRWSARVALGIEYYSGLGPLGKPLPAAAQDQYLFLAGDYTLPAGIDLNFGVGAGLNDASDRLTFKTIVAFPFDKLW